MRPPALAVVLFVLGSTFGLTGCGDAEAGAADETRSSVMQEIEIAAGERMRVLRRRFNSIPSSFRLSARAAGSDAEPSGVVEVHGSNWLVDREPVAFSLGTEQVVKKGFWDTFYAVYVTPDVDVVVTLRRSPNRALTLLVLVALLVVALAAAIFFAAARTSSSP